jgi:hypothetical protein
LSDGSETQRWICPKCDRRFSKHFRDIKPSSVAEARNTTALESITIAGEEKQTTKGRVLQFALHCRNEGLAEETVRLWYNRLKKISENTELDEPEAVKAYIAKATCAQGTKYNMVVIYNAYLEFIGKIWKRPKYRVEEKLPEFIPIEQELMPSYLDVAKKPLQYCRQSRKQECVLGKFYGLNELG